MAADPLDGCTGFDWDGGNLDKNWIRHRVAFWEAEEIFFNEPLIVRNDRKHAGSKARYATLGQADSGRRLFLSFTVRGHLIWIISAHDMTPKETRTYENTKA